MDKDLTLTHGHESFLSLEDSSVAWYVPFGKRVCVCVWTGHQPATHSPPLVAGDHITLDMGSAKAVSTPVLTSSPSPSGPASG